MTYNVVAAGNESTVVAEYEPQIKRSDAYQSEAALEQAFIKMLEEQGYTYLPIHKSEDLVANLRQQLELLNHYTFTDAEWQSFFSNKIANSNDGIVEKTRRIQEDYVQNLTREDGSTVNITLLDKKNIHNNRLQVINQYVETEGKHDTRYDVTILVNGLPLVHVELKRRGVPLKEAFNQINRYQRDSLRTQSITRTRPATAISKRAMDAPGVIPKKRATALSLRPFGPMRRTVLSLTWSILRALSLPVTHS